MRIFVSAGDVSGDRHAARLIKELRSLKKGLEVYGIGGDELKNEGAHIYFNLEELSVVGIVEVFERLPAILRAKRGARKILKSLPPDVVLLVDYPGFNLSLARYAHRMGLKVVYYIPPQIWAWGCYRVKYLQKWVDRIITILPFEVPFYRKHGIDVCFVGHPLLDEIDIKKEDEHLIALLPGSRMSEIKQILPLLLSISNNFPEENFVIPLASYKHKDYVDSLVKRGNPMVDVEVGSTMEILTHARLAVVASGTVTLECAIIGVPLIIVYKVSPLTRIFAKAVAKVPYIGLVNLVAGRKIVPEFLQTEATTENIVPVMRRIIKEKGEDMKVELYKVRRMLGEKGASRKAAEIIAGLR
ncbi:lipid-A-disaccharide synthase [candidate division WOR-3 bacterium]|nr:lipid-A-disaccharide synthase [candidate division WOR-3 bacterium]